MAKHAPGDATGTASSATRLQRLLTNSLILYLVGILAQKAWVLLNSDLTVLLRRLH